jgi:hypothetical protein
VVHRALSCSINTSATILTMANSGDRGHHSTLRATPPRSSTAHRAED